MRINIYYGGRGYLEDPTLYVISKMEQVLTELQVDVNIYNIYEQKNAISMLPQTMKGVDGVIFATTVEWLGIGGYMSQFLDACWQFADKDALANTYMQPVVMSTTYGEREAMVTLEKAWDILGGLPCSGLCGYVEDMVSFRSNTEYANIIAKKVETLYRTISQKIKGLPASNQAVTKSVQRTTTMELSPQETEQLSQYVSDESFVQTQKADIEDLSSMYRKLMGNEQEDDEGEYIIEFKNKYRGNSDYNAKYLFMIDGKMKPLFVYANGEEIECHYGREESVDAYMKLSRSTMDMIVSGHKTFQGAYSVGDMTAKGNFKNIRMLDEIFAFVE